MSQQLHSCWRLCLDNYVERMHKSAQECRKQHIYVSTTMLRTISPPKNAEISIDLTWPTMFVCMNACVRMWERKRESVCWCVYGCVCVYERGRAGLRYREAKPHRMPYLYRSFSAKEPYKKSPISRYTHELCLLTCIRESRSGCWIQGGEDPWDALSLQVIFRKRAL